MSIYSENVLHICPYRGVRRRVLDTTDAGDRKWTPGRAVMGDMSRTKTFDVHFSQGNGEFALFVRPAKQYRDACFEQLFGFGMECFDYTAERTIGIRAETVTVQQPPVTGAAPDAPSEPRV